MPARILVIRFSSIGDIVLTTPVFRHLYKQLEGGAEIHFLTKKKFASLLEANPYVHRIHAIERTVQEVLPDLEQLDFDYIIDLHRNIRSAVVKRRLKRLSFTFRKLNFRKWLWVRLGINLMPAMHVVDRYMATLKPFGINDDGLGLDYFIPGEYKAFAEPIPQSHAQGYVAVVVGAVHMGKRMEPAKWIDILRKAKRPVVLVGGAQDVPAGHQIAEALPQLVVNSCGKLNLHQSAFVLNQSVLVVSGDTGMMHIAAALGKPVVSLWGCTVPGLGMSAYRPHRSSQIIEPIDRKKRPCSKLGNRCKYGIENRCIQQIENERVVEAIERIWAQQKGP